MDQLHAEKKAFLHRMATSGSYFNSKEFYLGRIRFILDHHDFAQREQMFGMVLQAAMSDRALSVSELMYIINKVEEAHQKSMEANYNEQWQQP